MRLSIRLGLLLATVATWPVFAQSHNQEANTYVE